MGKKIEEADVKKECPSCGLGVSLDSTICEFCGWDFEEEDEWILQIEKLERELMLEKQRFEPGSVNHKIESTLHAPSLERAKAGAGAPAEARDASAPKPAPSAPARSEPPSRQVKSAEGRPQKTVAPAPAPAPRIVPVKPVEAPRPAKAPEPVSRPMQPVPEVRRIKSAPPSEAVDAGGKTRKVRVVRKVKQ